MMSVHILFTWYTDELTGCDSLVANEVGAPVQSEMSSVPSLPYPPVDGEDNSNSAYKASAEPLRSLCGYIFHRPILGKYTLGTEENNDGISEGVWEYLVY